MKLLHCVLCGALSVLAWAAPLSAQPIDTTNHPEKVYHVDTWLSLGITGLGIATNALGLARLRGKERIDDATLETLIDARLPWIDRSGLNQDILKMEEAEFISDYIFYGGVFMPFALMLDPAIRSDWFDLLLMYSEILAVSSNFYTYGPLGPTFIERYRPIVYYADLDNELRGRGGWRNSFFSGHVASTATGTFFFARVLSDYHPEWTTGQRLLVYALAALPPSICAYYRVRALKHWTTDTIVGGLVGAGFGMVGPWIHKKWREKRVRINGAYSSEFKGLGLQLYF